GDDDPARAGRSRHHGRARDARARHRGVRASRGHPARRADGRGQDARAAEGDGRMSIFTTLKLALRALWRNKVRSVLTMLGIIFGIGTVIAMIASGQGAREAVADVFRAMGTNLLIITNGSQASFGAAGG